MSFVSRRFAFLFSCLLASVVVLQKTEGHPTSQAYDEPISLNQSAPPPFSYSKFLEEWKKLYISQKELLLFIFQYAAPGMLHQKMLPKNVDFYDYLIDINLFQMNNLEELLSEGQNRMTRESLVEYVQKVIYRNQNPKDCSDIEVIGYVPKEICGFGCQIHHIAYCLSVALGEGKPLVVKGSPWHEFDSIFDVIMPISETCRYEMIETHNLKVKYVEVEDEYPIKEYLPPIFPGNIKEQIEEFHTDPFLWYIAQIIMYILRLRPNILRHLNLIEFSSPIVGVHVRRTDKTEAEAKCYPIKAYMKYVELYFRKIEQTTQISTKQVYLATDDPELIGEFRSR
ncbi:Alpha-(1,6)-fucosyltransferase [Thelohanellus kitauei]|uniref:Alpha-(1,6)-fucosyltransferase n=1 Tax=Thelohanellus kitauei TaxID=669202 RepID=A0A0C2MXA7_THEKT|nr:Alpha-(1,6)-fucosyltransferase [Thelohanellus kitauei]